MSAAIEVPCGPGVEGLWRALSPERRERIGRLFAATVRAHARLEAEELAVRLRELRKLTDEGEVPAPAPPPEPTPAAAEEEAEPVAAQRFAVRDNGDGTATIEEAAQRDVGLERVRDRFEEARAVAQQPRVQPTEALPRRGPRVQTVEVTDEEVVGVVRRLRRVSKSRVAIELGYRPGSKGYMAVGEALERLARAGAGGPLVEGGRIRNGIGYRLRPGRVLDVLPEDEPEPPAPDARAIERDRLREREGLRNAGLLGAPSPRRTPVERRERDARPPAPATAPEPPKPRTEPPAERTLAHAPIVPPAETDEELRDAIVVLCTDRKLGVVGMAEELKVPAACVAQAVQWLVQRNGLVKQPPGVYQAV